MMVTLSDAEVREAIRDWVHARTKTRFPLADVTYEYSVVIYPKTKEITPTSEYIAQVACKRAKDTTDESVG